MQTKKYVAIAALSLSLLGTTFIQQWEGTKLEAYPDSIGVPTVCTGSTRGVYLGMKATPQECADRLVEDSGRAGKALSRLVKVPVTQEMYDALLSLVFNIGEGNFARSTLLRRLNQGAYTEACNEFLRWHYAGGKPLRGLLLRRQAERKLCLSGIQGVIDADYDKDNGDSRRSGGDPRDALVRGRAVRREQGGSD